MLPIPTCHPQQLVCGNLWATWWVLDCYSQKLQMGRSDAWAQRGLRSQPAGGPSDAPRGIGRPPPSPALCDSGWEALDSRTGEGQPMVISCVGFRGRRPIGRWTRRRAVSVLIDSRKRDRPR